MAAELLAEQLDFILCFYGLAFILMSATALACARSEDTGDTGEGVARWVWLAWFGACHGLHEWLEMVIPSLGHPQWLRWTALVLLVASFVLLVEFARRTAGRLWGRVPTPGITLGLVALSFLGWGAGLTGWNVAARYTLGLTGALWSAIVLLQWLRKSGRRETHLVILAVATGAYAVATGLIVPRADFLPASVVNQEAFLALTGCPIQLVRGFLAFVMMVALWRHYETLRLAPLDSGLSPGRAQRAWLWWSVVLAVQIGGWCVTARAGVATDRDCREELRELVRVTAAMVNGARVARLTGTASDESAADHRRLESQLTRALQGIANARSCFLMRESDGQAVYLLYLRASGKGPVPNPETARKVTDPVLQEVFASGASAVSGPHPDPLGQHLLAYAPVQDDSGKAAGILGLEVDALPYTVEVAQRRISPIIVTMLISLLVLLFGLVQIWEQGGREALVRLSGHQALLLQSLQRSEGRLRALTAAAQDAIVMMGPDGAVSFWNAAATRIFQYAPEEALGRDLHHLLAPPQFEKAFREAFHVFLVDGQGAAMNGVTELTALRKDAVEFPIELSLAPVMLDGKWHAVGIIRDISARVQDQDALRRAKDDVEATNVQLERAVEHAREMAWQAEAASRAKSEFLANMSHEIRTPMNAVLGMTGLLIDSGLEAEQRHFAEIVRSSGESLLAIINDILDFSKIEAGHLHLDAVEFDLREGLSQTMAALGVRATKKGLALTCRVAPEVPTLLKGDPGRVRQVVTNLVDNAIKFTARGSVTLEVSALTHSTDRVGLRFTVTDTGIGIAAERVQALFSPFTQADGSITRRFGGTGLGLSISRRLVEMMGGQIQVETREGAGSTFWFTAFFDKWSEGERPAPGRAPAGGRTEEPAVPGEGPSAPRLTLEQRRQFLVLVAEDNVTNQQVALGILGRLGFQAEAVSNGAEALKVLETVPYDLVLMDCQMPEMDGFEATRRIRAPESAVLNREVPIVALTAHALEGDRRACLAVGMNDYVSKPVNSRILAEVLDRWLSGEGGTGAAPTASPVAQGGLLDTVFDEADFIGRVMGNRDLGLVVATCFLEDISRCVTDLCEALERSDAEATARAAHVIKGAAGNVGGVVLSRKASEIQELARAGDLSEVVSLRDGILREHARLELALRAFVVRLHSSPEEISPGPGSGSA